MPSFDDRVQMIIKEFPSADVEYISTVLKKEGYSEDDIRLLSWIIL